METRFEDCESVILKRFISNVCYFRVVMERSADNFETNDLNRRLCDGRESIARELDAQFRNRLCELVDAQMNHLYKRRRDPEDIVQSVLKSFYVRASNGEFHFADRESLWRLLKKIARNKMLNRIERDRAGKRDIAKEQAIVDEPVGVDPSSAQAHVLAVALQHALGELGSLSPEIFRLQLFGYSVPEVIEIILRDLEPPYPQILQLRLSGMSEQEIANELGCLRGQVRYKLQRLVERLRVLLGSEEAELD